MKYRLADLCNIIKGITGITKAIPGSYPLVTLSDERKSHNEFQFNAKAVIVPLISSSGHGHASMKRVHYQEGKFALGNILCAVIPKDESKLNAKFLHLYLQLLKEDLLVSLMKGAANVSLPMNKLANVEIEVPDIRKQLQVIELERKASELQKDLKHKLASQEVDVHNLRRAYLKEAMLGKLVAQNPNDESACDLLKRIRAEKEKLNNGKKEKPLPEIDGDEILFAIPKNWVWCRLGEICLRVTDGEHITPIKRDKGKMLLSAKNIRDGYISYENVDYISEEDFQKSIKRCNPEKDNILIVSVGGTIGRSTIMNEDKEFAIVRSVALIKPFDLSMSKYLKFILDSPVLQREITIRSWGTAQPCLYINQIRELIIPLPSLSEQTRIVKKLEEIMKYCGELEQSIQESRVQANNLLRAALKEALQTKEDVFYTPTKIISVAAEPGVQKGKIIPIQRKALASRIIQLNITKPDFGVTMFQKNLQVVEYHIKADYETYYAQNLRGPDDRYFMDSFTKEMTEKDWFRVEERGLLRAFVPGKNKDELNATYRKYFESKREDILFVLRLMDGKTLKEAELISTLYAVWNNRLIRKEEIEPKLLAKDVYEWSPEKGEKYGEYDTIAMFEWMKDNGLIPIGFGKEILKMQV